MEWEPPGAAAGSSREPAVAPDTPPCYQFSDKQNGIVGFVSIVINPPILPYNMTYATIGQISVDKNFDTVTIGDALLKKCFKVAQKFKCSKVLSLCEPKNIEFYKKCGFIQSSYTMEKVL